MFSVVRGPGNEVGNFVKLFQIIIQNYCMFPRITIISIIFKKSSRRFLAGMNKSVILEVLKYYRKAMNINPPVISTPYKPPPKSIPFKYQPQF